MKVLKFGGSSLANGEPLNSVISIIKRANEEETPIVVVSARGKATDQLIDLYSMALFGEDYQETLDQFFEYQQLEGIDLLDLQYELNELLNTVKKLKVDSPLLRDKILAFGELLSANTLVQLLEKEGLKAVVCDARNLIKTLDAEEVTVDHQVSQKQTRVFFENLEEGTITVITGFIASDVLGNTVTLGRNGSNYTASLIASFVNAVEVQNWTDVDGVYSASPHLVKNARRIPHLSFKEANELANFGVNLLHAKTILPLVEKAIPLRIYNTGAPFNGGTLIDERGSGKGIKAVSAITDVALISISGRGLLGKVGIDTRIFSVLSHNNISVRLISQASSERGIGFIVNKDEAELGLRLLKEEFKQEIVQQDISNIEVNRDMAIIAIVGRHNYALEKAIHGLRRNRIWMHLISNSINGEQISLVIDNKALKKAVNVVHNQVFGVVKTLNVFAIGKGTVGGKLIDQILNTTDKTIERRKLKINIVGIADSKKILFKEEGLSRNWREQLAASNISSSVDAILELLKESALENVVIADNTSSQGITDRYPDIVKSGFDIVASNKKANSISYRFYQDLRNELQKKGRLFLYETNVGAGLPLIDTLKNLYNSSDRVRKIRGVFSGSLSYVFNNFSVKSDAFATILEEAKSRGLTEPDPREDLGGTDVARKLLILAREIGLPSEFEEVQIENLIPEGLRNVNSYSDFQNRSEELNRHFEDIRKNLKPGEVLRYVGDLDVEENSLKVELVKASTDSPLGNIKNADSIFEIYTDGYGEQPIVIQGAGAGAEVTAGGVYSDLLRIGAMN